MSNLATITNNILADSGIDDINVVVTTGSYSNPPWITALAWTKITGVPAFVTSVTASSPLFSSGGTTPNLTIQQASGSQNGFLSSTDWNTFNNKAPSVVGGYLPLSGGTLTGPLGGTSASFSGDITANRYRGVNSLVLNSYQTVNPSSNVYLYSQPNDRDSWIYLDSADLSSNWGIYHRQIDTAVAGLPGNSIGFIGGGASGLQAWISLANGNGFFAGSLQLGTIGGGSSTATPNSINLTSTFSNTAGSNLKLILFNDFGGNVYGIGVSNSRMDFNVPSGAAYSFYTGNVLIGTSSDVGFKLDVNGTGRFSGTLSTSAGNAISAGGTTFAVSPSSTRGIININGSSDQLLTFSSQSYIYNSSSLFRLLSSSDIDFVSGGIQRLLISASTGAATFSSSVTATNFISNVTNSYGLIMNRPSVSNFIGILYQTASSSQWFVGLRETGTNNYIIYNEQTVTDALTINRINNSATFSSAVNVGGDIQLNSTTSILKTSANNSVLVLLANPSLVDNEVRVEMLGRTYSPSGNTIFYRAATQVFTSSNASIEYMRIASGGNVGIGPAISFTDGDSFLIQNSGVWNVTMGLNNTGAGGRKWNIFSTNNSFGQGAGKLLFYNTTAGTDAMVIDSSNRVGIGTNNPTREMVLYRPSGEVHFKLANGTTGQSTTDGFDIAIDSSGGAYLINREAQPMNFFTSGSIQMSITAGGNLLVGNVSDNGYRLRVNGTGFFDNNVMIVPQSAGWAEGLSFTMPTTARWGGLRWRRERGNNDGNWYVGYTALDSTDDLVFGANNGGAQVDNIIRLTKAGPVSFVSNVTAASFFESSDATIKTLVQDNYQAKGIESVVAKLYMKNGKQELGYFAQDLENILPNAVNKGTDGLLNLSYREVHTAKIAALEKRITELESQLKNN
jgi:hypothetical protein